MKKILLKFAAVLAIFGSVIMFSCEEPPPPIPDCEREGYGEVVVKNSTGYEIKVDVTYTSTGVNYEKWLNHGSSYTYEMDAGKVYIWVSLDGVNWKFDTYYLDACETLTYTWYSTGKKSTSELYLEISDKGKIIKTITDIKRGYKKQ